MDEHNNLIVFISDVSWSQTTSVSISLYSLKHRELIYSTASEQNDLLNKDIYGSCRIMQKVSQADCWTFSCLRYSTVAQFYQQYV